MSSRPDRGGQLILLDPRGMEMFSSGGNREVSNRSTVTSAVPHRKELTIYGPGNRIRLSEPTGSLGSSPVPTAEASPNGGTMKLRPTDNHSARSLTRRSLLLGISLLVVAGLWAPAAHAQSAAPTATEQPLRPTLP